MIVSDFKLLENIVKPYKVYNLYHFKPVEGFSIDSRTIKRNQAYIAIKGLHHDGHDFIEEAVKKGACFVVAQRYIDPKPKVPFFIVEDTYRALHSICVYIRKRKKPFVYAITGSVGKTTTKEMLAFLLEPHKTLLKSKKTENNFLGVAKTILALDKEEVVVQELGTNRKGEIEDLARMCLPDAGIITFIKPVHLEGLGTIKGVLDEKISLFNVNSGMKAIMNRDDSYLAKVLLPHKIYWFGKAKSNFVWAKLKKRDNQYTSFIVNGGYELKLPFYQEYFISNALAAIAAARLFDIPLAALVKRMNSFEAALRGRMQFEIRKRVCIINDAYNANPYSCAQALRFIKNRPGRKIAVLGDMLELGKKSVYYHESLAREVLNNKIDYCLTFGSYTAYLQRALKAYGYQKGFHFSSHKKIADFIRKAVNNDHDKTEKYLVFIKGSRKMMLEKVVEHL